MGQIKKSSKSGIGLYAENELRKTLDEIWNNRNFINNDDIKGLKLYTNKGMYDEIACFKLPKNKS